MAWGADPSRGSFTQYSSPSIYSPGRWGLAPPAPVPTSPSVTAPVTGVNPMETSYSLYGHIIPLLVFGRGRVGGEIISGPWFASGLASGINSFGLPADPTRSLTCIEVAFDSEVVWEGSQVGAGTLSSAGFSTEPITIRFYTGSLTQPADALEITNFGADAVAYRGQVLLAIQNLPLAATKFGKYPYVSAKFVDEDGEAVNLGEAFERLAYSPYVGYTSAEFETSGITDGVPDGGLIITQDTDFLSLIQQFGRIYRSWDILQTDKLRIVDRGDSVTADIVLDKSRLMDQVTIVRESPASVPHKLELTTIDPDADYTLIPSTASEPREPVNVSSSVETESVYLPIIMDSSSRLAIVTYAAYQDEVGRKRINATSMIYGMEMEPGDLVAGADLGEDFVNETYKVIETLHGANYSVEFTAESFLHCEITDEHFPLVMLLMGFEGADGSQSAPGFTDEGPNEHGTASFHEYAHIDTTQYKFGSSSLRLESTISSDSILRFSDSPDWQLSASNSDQFTVECWVRFATLTALVTGSLIVGQYYSAGKYAWGLETTDTDELLFRLSSDGTTWNVEIASTTAALTTDVWYHIAVDKDAAGKIRIYKNGVMIASDTPADSSMFDAATSLMIGNAPFLFDAHPMDGWMDELRITKGIARYASDGGFAVPTAAFPRS
jgi:hypothetical protein